ncbi:hypothetical protein CBER1_03653 [Cercospora berteroae]|uniref:F-box domain-containing protein n=1 Tax=Cercospora berteroae TaxID=357750 RepID=A0A2S6CLL0_9PEZI|nr:hypothetical protein CBER1_03653 [Cercospora berteroae]
MSDEPTIADDSTASTEQENTAEQECFRLFDLPPELVVRVLEFAVVVSTKSRPLRIAMDSIEPWEDSCSDESLSAGQPAITRTCHLLRDEGLKLFYAENIFLGATSNDDAAALWKWGNAIGQEKLKRIDRLYIEYVSNDEPWIYTYLDGRLLTDVEGGRQVDVRDFWCDMDEFEFQAGEEEPSYFYRFDHDKITLDFAHGTPRFRISFQDRSQEGSSWIASDYCNEIDEIFGDDEYLDWWAAEEEG